jgi:tetratricopeptide (TPR) repeat protein
MDEHLSRLCDEVDMHRDTRNWPRMLEAAQKIIAHDPNLAPPYIAAGEAKFRLGNPNDATAHFRDALRIDPESELAHYWTGVALLEMADHTGAMQHLQRCLNRRTNNASAWHVLGVVCLRQHNYSDAITCARKALEFDPHFSDALNLLVIARAQGDQISLRAERDGYQRALNADPNNPWAHANLATVYERSGDYANAGWHYREALRLAPDHPVAEQGLHRVTRLSAPFFSPLRHVGRFITTPYRLFPAGAFGVSTIVLWACAPSQTLMRVLMPTTKTWYAIVAVTILFCCLLTLYVCYSMITRRLVSAAVRRHEAVGAGEFVARFIPCLLLLFIAGAYGWQSIPGQDFLAKLWSVGLSIQWPYSVIAMIAILWKAGRDGAAEDSQRKMREWRESAN